MIGRSQRAFLLRVEIYFIIKQYLSLLSVHCVLKILVFGKEMRSPASESISLPKTKILGAQAV